MEANACDVYLRSNYHFGPQKIQMYLERYRDITVSVSGIIRRRSRSEHPWTRRTHG
jgi:hypothetical protein